PYVAPERLAGAADTSATDIYSLGVVMYELVTGSLLARGPLPVTFDALPVAAPLAAVIRRCLEPKPDRRPASAAEVLAAIDDQSQIVTERLSARARRRKTWWVLGGAVAASLALAVPLLRDGEVRGGAAAKLTAPAAPRTDRVVPPDHDARPSSAPMLARPAGAPAVARRRARKPLRPAASKPVMDAAPDGTRRLLESAEAHLRAGLIEEACVEGDAATRQAPSSPPAWEFLGRCYMRLGEPAQARDYYRRYLQLAPDGTRAVFIRAIVDEQGT
ncbi:MAG TPA: tetratricopeptide repeat protein, partial [Polyangia bacterium]